MEVKLKQKYAQPKSVGGNKSKHNDGTKRRARPKRKATDRERAVIQATQPLVTLVVLQSGKKKFIHEWRSA